MLGQQAAEAKQKDGDEVWLHLLGCRASSWGFQATDQVDQIVKQLAQIGCVAASSQALIHIVLRMLAQSGLTQLSCLISP